MLKAIFDYDNPFMSFICRLIDLFVLSLLWFICSLPLVTIGASTCSLYYAVIKSVRRQRSYPTKEFLNCFRRNLKPSFVILIPLVFLGMITFFLYIPFSLHFWFSEQVVYKIGSIFLAIAIYIYFSVVLWSFPLLSRFEASLLKILELATLQTLFSPFTTIFALLLTAVSTVLVFVEPLLLCIVPGLLFWGLTFLMEPKLLRIYQEQVMPQQNAIPEHDLLDTWYIQ